MKIIKWLNPQSWAGQIFVIVGMLAIGALIDRTLFPCPPVSVVNNSTGKVVQKKNKGSNVSSEVDTTIVDCSECCKKKSRKEKKAIRKGV